MMGFFCSRLRKQILLLPTNFSTSFFVSQDLTWAQREEERKVEKSLREEAEKKTMEAVENGKKGKFIVVGQRGRRRMVWTDREG